MTPEGAGSSTNQCHRNPDEDSSLDEPDRLIEGTRVLSTHYFSGVYGRSVVKIVSGPRTCDFLIRSSGGGSYSGVVVLHQCLDRWNRIASPLPTQMKRDPGTNCT